MTLRKGCPKSVVTIVMAKWSNIVMKLRERILRWRLLQDSGFRLIGGAACPGWCGTICTQPSMVSISVRPERYSHHLIKESGEFVINLPTESLVRAVDWCGVKSGRDVDKFSAMHLTPSPAAKVGTVLVEESPVNLECKVTQVIPLGSHDLFLAEVVAVDVDERLLDESGKLCLNKANLIVYSHGDYLALGRKLGSFGYSVRKKPRKK